MSLVVNSELRYNEEPLPLGSSRRVVEYQNSKGVITQGNRAYIKIPNGRNQFIDTGDAYIKFSVNTTWTGTNLPTVSGDPGSQINAGGDIRLSGSGAVSFIRSIQIFSNSALVCTIDNANRIASILQVANHGYTSHNAESIMGGISFDDGQSLLGNDIIKTYGYPRSGSTATVSNAPTMTFCLNANILGCLGDGTLLPVNALKNGLELQIEFESDGFLSYNTVSKASNAPTLTSIQSSFFNISYVAPIIELDDSSMIAVNRENGFGSSNVMWSGVNYHSSILQWSAAQQDAVGEYTALVPSNRFTSLKNILLGAFKSDVSGTPTSKATDELNVPVIPVSSLMYRMNGTEYPLNRINTVEKAVQQTIACFSNNSNSVGNTIMTRGKTALNNRQINVSATEPLTSIDRGVIGVNLESWAETDAISGLDVSESDTEVLLGSDGGTAITSSQLCFVSTYDIVYVISQEGVLSASWS